MSIPEIKVQTFFSPLSVEGNFVLPIDSFGYNLTVLGSQGTLKTFSRVFRLSTLNMEAGDTFSIPFQHIERIDFSVFLGNTNLRQFSEVGGVRLYSSQILSRYFSINFLDLFARGRVEVRNQPLEILENDGEGEEVEIECLICR